MTEESSSRSFFSRQRRANVEGGRQGVRKVKVSPEEEGQLVRIAAKMGVTVPRLLLESALAVEQNETPTQRKQAMAELFAMHRLLAAISNNVNQLARQANATGEIPAESAATLRKVREVAERIDTVIDGLSS